MKTPLILFLAVCCFFGQYIWGQQPIQVIFTGIEKPGQPYSALYEDDGSYTIRDYRYLPDSSLAGRTVLVSEADYAESPLFLFRGILVPKRKNISGRTFDSRFLFPGESVHFETATGAYHLYARGAVPDRDSEDNLNPFSTIRDYQLRVRKISGDQVDDQVLLQLDLPFWQGEEYEGSIQLHWIGDLDSDGNLDVLLTTADEAGCAEIIFFLSSKAEKGNLMRQVSKEADFCGC